MYTTEKRLLSEEAPDWRGLAVAELRVCASVAPQVALAPSAACTGAAPAFGARSFEF